MTCALCRESTGDGEQLVPAVALAPWGVTSAAAAADTAIVCERCWQRVTFRRRHPALARALRSADRRRPPAARYQRAMAARTD